MRILLFGDGCWAANSLGEMVQAGHTVVGVVLRTKPSGPELERTASFHGIPVLQPSRVNDPQWMAAVRTAQPELGISIAYNQIFRPAAFGFLPFGLINFHAGKLPFYRGRNVINWAILNGEKEIGLTSHFIDDGIDTGGIIHQKTFPIGWTDGYGDVLCRIVSAFPSFVRETLAMLESGRYENKPQNKEQGTYFPGRGPDDEWLDWNDSSVQLHNKVRAITRPGPGAKTLIGETEVRIWRAYFDTNWANYLATPGVVVGRSEGGVLVKTGDSVLLIQEIQVSGSPPEVPEWRLGTRLGVDLRCMLTALRTRFKKDEERLCNEERSQ
jgi:methionyl-tRNA formyltransferase